MVLVPTTTEPSADMPTAPVPIESGRNPRPVKDVARLAIGSVAIETAKPRHARSRILIGRSFAGGDTAAGGPGLIRHSANGATSGSLFAVGRDREAECASNVRVAGQVGREAAIDVRELVCVAQREGKD